MPALKVSDLIALLRNQLEQHGDLPVYISHEWTEPLCNGDNDVRGVRFIVEQKKQPKTGIEYFPARIEIS